MGGQALTEGHNACNGGHVKDASGECRRACLAQNQGRHGVRITFSGGHLCLRCEKWVEVSQGGKWILHNHKPKKLSPETRDRKKVTSCLLSPRLLHGTNNGSHPYSLCTVICLCANEPSNLKHLPLWLVLWDPNWSHLFPSACLNIHAACLPWYLSFGYSERKLCLLGDLLGALNVNFAHPIKFILWVNVFWTPPHTHTFGYNLPNQLYTVWWPTDQHKFYFLHAVLILITIPW